VTLSEGWVVFRIALSGISDVEAFHSPFVNIGHIITIKPTTIAATMSTKTPRSSSGKHTHGLIHH
jgi:hypothetical protein